MAGSIGRGGDYARSTRIFGKGGDMTERLLPGVVGTRLIPTPAYGRQSACARKNWY